MARRIHSWVATLALAAMVLRALIPAGWMPSPAGQGETLVICTAAGLQTLSPPDDPAPHDDPADAPAPPHKGTPCVFAAVAAFSAPPAVAPLPVPGPTAVARLALQTWDGPRSVPRLTVHAPRGPPILA